MTAKLAGYRDMRRRAVDALDHLKAIEMFSPMNLAALVAHLDDMFAQIDTRLATVEKRLDAAGIKELPDGIPDDEGEQYFTLNSLSNFEPSRTGQ